MIPGARRALIVMVCLIAAVLPPLVARAAAPTLVSPAAKTGDPTQNTTPSTAFVNACWTMGTSRSDNDACDAAAGKDFAAVWKAEGLPATFTLPGDFDTLSVPLQLLAIANVERVARGEAPMAGLSKRLNALTQTAADNDRDPGFPSPFDGTGGGGNWAAAGNSALLDDFYWMYDDGLGSYNGDCTTTNRSGCWGHRHNILLPGSTPLVMGAAVAYRTPHYGTSIATEYISGDSTDAVNVTPRWAAMATTLPIAVVVHVSAARRHVHRHRVVALSGRVVSRASRKPVNAERVALCWRVGAGPWRRLRVKQTNPHGVVTFTLRPSRTRGYRLQALGTHRIRAGASASLQITVD